MIRVERGHGVQLRILVLDEETPVDADALPTVTFTSWDGTVISADVEAAAVPGESPTVTGAYVVDAPVSNDLTLMTAVWSFEVGGSARRITETIEVVAGFYFPISALRAKPGLESVERYPYAELVNARMWIEQLIDREVGTSFVERFHVDRRTVTASTDLYVDHPYIRSLVSATVDAAEVDAIPEVGGIEVAAVWPEGVAELAYTAGWETSCPADLRDAALTAARYHLLATVGASGLPDRTRQQSTSDGTVILSVAGEKAPTGLPEVDVVISDYKRRCRYPMMR